jgi:hypothetical protein
LLSLLVIPVIYTLIDDAQVSVVRLFHRKPLAEVQSGFQTAAGNGGDFSNGEAATLNGVSKPVYRWRWWMRKKQ